MRVFSRSSLSASRFPEDTSNARLDKPPNLAGSIVSKVSPGCTSKLESTTGGFSSSGGSGSGLRYEQATASAAAAETASLARHEDGPRLIGPTFFPRGMCRTARTLSQAIELGRLGGKRLECVEQQVRQLPGI